MVDHHRNEPLHADRGSREHVLFLEFGGNDRRRRIPSFSRATESRLQQPRAHRHAGLRGHRYSARLVAMECLTARAFVQIPSQTRCERTRPTTSQLGLKDGAWGKAIVSDGEAWLSRQVPKLSVITFADADAVRARWA